MSTKLEPSRLNGSTAHVPLDCLLEECRELGVTGAIDVAGPDGLGVIELHEGKVHAAAFGLLEAREALDRMRAMRSASYELRPTPLERARAHFAAAAVALGWPPPGRREPSGDAPAAPGAWILERLGDFAHALAARRRNIGRRADTVPLSPAGPIHSRADTAVDP